MGKNKHEVKFKEATGQEFSKFYQDQMPRLTWHLSNYTKDFEVAEDFANDAFEQALKKIETYDKNKSQIQTWLYTIARHIVIQSWNKKQKMPSVSIDKEYDVNLSLSTFLPYEDGKEDLEKYNTYVEKAKIIKEVIKNLPPKYKEVMELRELDNMQYKEIAKYLKRNESTVKSQIRKGRELIRDKVQKKFDYIDKHGLE